jgi:hypothetical protein
MNYLVNHFYISRDVLLAAPRLLVPLGALALLGALSGCVPAINYEEATSAAEVQGEARRRAELELAAEKARIRELEGELKTRDRGLEDGNQQLAQERYEHGVLAKEHDETSSVLEQLRGDLSRANENLKSYAADNARLQGELSKAKTDAPVSSLSSITQALQMAVAAAHLSEQASVRPGKDNVTVHVEAGGLFASGSADVRGEITPLLEAAQRLFAEGQGVRGELREGAADPAVPTALGHERRERLVRALEDKKLAALISYRAAESAASGAGSYDLVLRAETPE